MTDRGILFSAAMVDALLEGKKTQTRRLLQPQPPSWCDGDRSPGYSCMTPAGHIEFRGIYVDESGVDHGPAAKFIKLPMLKGDRLWVRESYYQRGHWERVAGAVTKGGRQKWQFVPDDDAIRFDPPRAFRKGRHNADPETTAWHRRLGRFMPRRYSRLTLAVTGVRVERLRAISGEDVLAEGCPVDPLYRDTTADGSNPHMVATGPGQWMSTTLWYHRLWDTLNAEPGRRWDDNPWIVAVTFTVEQRNIDQPGAGE